MIFSKVQTLYLCPQGKQASINIIYVIFIQNIQTWSKNREMINKQCWLLLSTWYYWTQVVATQINGSMSYIQAHKKYNWTIAPSTLGLKGDSLIHLYEYNSQQVPSF